MSEYYYECSDCGHQFDQFFFDRGLPVFCPVCGSKDIIPIEQAEENRRINAQESYRESLREKL